MKARTRTIALIAMTALMGLSLATGPADGAPADREPDGRVAVLEDNVFVDTNAHIGRASLWASEHCGITVVAALQFALVADRTGRRTLVCEGMRFQQDFESATRGPDGYVTLYSQQHARTLLENVRIREAATEAARLCGGGASYRDIQKLSRQVDRTGVASNVCSSLWVVQGTKP